MKKMKHRAAGLLGKFRPGHHGSGKGALTRTSPRPARLRAGSMPETLESPASPHPHTRCDVRDLWCVHGAGDPQDAALEAEAESEDSFNAANREYEPGLFAEIREGWVRRHMLARASDYTTHAPLAVSVLTWNLAAKKPPPAAQLRELLEPLASECAIFAIGLQARLAAPAAPASPNTSTPVPTTACPSGKRCNSRHPPRPPATSTCPLRCSSRACHRLPNARARPRCDPIHPSVPPLAAPRAATGSARAQRAERRGRRFWSARRRGRGMGGRDHQGGARGARGCGADAGRSLMPGEPASRRRCRRRHRRRRQRRGRVCAAGLPADDGDRDARVRAQVAVARVHGTTRHVRRYWYARRSPPPAFFVFFWGDGGASPRARAAGHASPRRIRCPCPPSRASPHLSPLRATRMHAFKSPSLPNPPPPLAQACSG